MSVKIAIVAHHPQEMERVGHPGVGKQPEPARIGPAFVRLLDPRSQGVLDARRGNMRPSTKARHEFTIDERSAGIVLTGTEIKSILRQANLYDAYARIEAARAWLIGAQSRRRGGNRYNHEPSGSASDPRRSEIDELLGRTSKGPDGSCRSALHQRRAGRNSARLAEQKAPRSAARYRRARSPARSRPREADASSGRETIPDRLRINVGSAVDAHAAGSPAGDVGGRGRAGREHVRQDELSRPTGPTCACAAARAKRYPRPTAN